MYDGKKRVLKELDAAVGRDEIGAQERNIKIGEDNRGTEMPHQRYRGGNKVERISYVKRKGQEKDIAPLPL